MRPVREFDQAWKDLASLIKSLPPEEQQRFQVNLVYFAHDLRQALAIIFSAEDLLRTNNNLSGDDLEALNMILNACKRAIGMLTEFAQPFDGQSTLPLSSPSEDSDKTPKI